MKTEAEMEMDRQKKSIHHVICTHACTLPVDRLNCKQTVETFISKNLQIDRKRDRNDRVIKTEREMDRQTVRDRERQR